MHPLELGLGLEELIESIELRDSFDPGNGSSTSIFVTPPALPVVVLLPPAILLPLAAAPPLLPPASSIIVPVENGEATGVCLLHGGRSRLA